MAAVSFGRNESFPLRFGWIAKGLKALNDDPKIFNREDATVILGVGKNMVDVDTLLASSHRGCQYSQQNDERPRTDTARSALPSATAATSTWKTRARSGCFTGCSLAIRSAPPPSIGSSITSTSRHSQASEVATALTDFVNHEVSSKVAVTTLKRDAQLVLRMYSRTLGGTRLTLEDALDSPLATLNLQERLDGRNYRAAPTDRAEIPLNVFAFAVAQLFDQTSVAQLAIQDLMYSGKNHCAPGAVFRMTEEGLIRKLESLCDAYPHVLRLDRTAGVFQLYKLGTLDDLSIIRDWYSGRWRETCRMSVAGKIDVNTRYTRSTNVERDRGSRAIINAYLPTACGISLLDDVARALGPTDQPRAWSLIGPYGSGKSSFALFLHELLGREDGVKGAAAKALAAGSPDLVVGRFARQQPWCRVVLTGSEEPLLNRLLAALDEAATSFWAGKRGRKPIVIEEIRQARNGRKVTNSRLLELVDALQVAVEHAGAGGLLIVIDELGKFLEYEARQGGGGVFLLQELAERAFRGRKANLMLFVLLHQGFDLYARGMGEKLKNDWTKVQGRFQSVSFVETSEQTLRVVAAAFSNSLTEAEQLSIRKRTRRIAHAIGAANGLPTGLNEEEATDIFAACYPMHPISLLVLPTLCQKFAQNERTLFSYLGSREPHGFRDSIGSLENVGDWVYPAEVYDYFVQNQPAVLADPLTHRRWAEVVTAVERAESADWAGSDRWGARQRFVSAR